MSRNSFWTLCSVLVLLVEAAWTLLIFVALSYFQAHCNDADGECAGVIVFPFYWLMPQVLLAPASLAAIIWLLSTRRTGEQR